MVERKPNPMHLAQWAIAGAVLATSPWFLVFLPIPRFPVIGHGLWPMLWAGRLQALVFFGPLLCGVPLWWRTQGRFKDGVRNEVWSEAELEPVRAMLQSRRWNWMTWAVVALCVGSIVGLAFGMRLRNGTFIYILTLTPQTVGTMRRAVTPPVRQRGGLLDWNNIQPIRSEHWGQREA